VTLSKLRRYTCKRYIYSDLKLIIKYFLKPLGFFLELVFAYGMLYLLISIFGGVISVGGDAVEDGMDVFVRTNGVHTDIVLPVETETYDWKNFIPTDDYPSNSTFRYIAIGWGDKGFFLDTPTWAELKFSTAFNAVFVNSPTAMHVEYLDHEPAISESCKLVQMEKGNYSELIEYITGTFKTKEGQVDIIPNRGYWNNDNFYEANGNYSMFRTCNRWTNVALKVAGIRTGLYSLFSNDIMRHLD